MLPGQLSPGAVIPLGQLLPGQLFAEQLSPGAVVLSPLRDSINKVQNISLFFWTLCILERHDMVEFVVVVVVYCSAWLRLKLNTKIGLHTI